MNKQRTIPRILKYVEPYKRWLVIAMICMVIVASMGGAQAYMVRPILDDIFVKKNSTMLMLVPLLILGIFLVKGVFYYTYNYLLEKVGQSITVAAAFLFSEKTYRGAHFAHTRRRQLDPGSCFRGTGWHTEGYLPGNFSDRCNLLPELAHGNHFHVSSAVSHISDRQLRAAAPASQQKQPADSRPGFQHPL